MKIWGIVNVTRDSFSDGGRFLTHADALAHARRLLEEGADVLDLGAESTHPDSEAVPAEIEVERLGPLVASLKPIGARLSIDTRKPAVMAAMLALGVDVINDVNGLASEEAISVVAPSPARVVVMHSVQSSAGRAGRPETTPAEIVGRITAFFAERVETLQRAGVALERVILDPGMGFFLGVDPLVSVEVLRKLGEFRRFGCELLISVSRKSFIGALIDREAPPPAKDRGAASLAAELWALAQGVDHIRTHAVRELRDASRVWTALT